MSKFANTLITGPELLLRAADVAKPISTRVRLLNLTAVILPFLGFVAVVVSLWGRGFHWVDAGLLLGMYALTTVGITVGYHRLFTHRSFETNRVVQFVLAVLGSMAVEGPLLKWVAVHRRHHQHSDTHEDPHSPHEQGNGFLGLVRGLWHAHVGWFFQAVPQNLPHYVKDLRQSLVLRTASKLFPLWVILGVLIPAALGGLLTGSWMGAASGLLWGGLARIFLVHHVTWSINSICHLWGRQPFPTGDHSRNNVVFGVLGFGEGWHNNHHAFPTSARFGLRWWQIDLGYWLICLLALLGLASEVRQMSEVRADRVKHLRGTKMAVQPLIDHGQELARPEGQTIGFVDTKEQFDAVTKALKAAGYVDSKTTALQGEDGIELLERLQKTFNFGDGEDAFVEAAIKELRAGHYALRIETDDREAAVRAAGLAEPLGAHSFSYFGTWANERLTR